MEVPPGPPRSPAWRPRRLNGADYDSFVDDVFNDDGSEAENDDEILDRSSTADAKSPLSDPPHPAKVQNDLGSRDCKDECKSPSKLPYAETCKTPPSRQQPFIDNNNKPLQKQATDGTMRSSKGRTRKRDCEESNTLYNKDRVVNRAPRELFKGKRTRLKKQSHK